MQDVTLSASKFLVWSVFLNFTMVSYEFFVLFGVFFFPGNVDVTSVCCQYHCIYFGHVCVCVVESLRICHKCIKFDFTVYIYLLNYKHFYLSLAQCLFWVSLLIHGAVILGCA
jgi:hypothetical protein